MPVVISTDFWTWFFKFNFKFISGFKCEPMDDAMKVMAEEEPELKEVQFIRVEAEEKPNISMQFQVAAVPTFLFFRGGSDLAYFFCFFLYFIWAEVHVYNLPKPWLSSYLWVAWDSNLRPSHFYTNICMLATFGHHLFLIFLQFQQLFN